MTEPRATVYGRPPAAVKTAALEALTARGRQMDALLTACLAAFAADPDAFLALVDEHWPKERPVGRPRKTSATEPPTEPAPKPARRKRAPARDPAEPESPPPAAQPAPTGPAAKWAGRPVLPYKRPGT